MSIKEDIEKVEKKMQEVENYSVAMEFVKDYKKTNIRMFRIIITILFMWLATIGAFMYYIFTVDYETITEEANTDNGGNACVGDNCNNGEINYGNSKENN